MKKVIEHQGNRYEMGAGFSEVRKGDVIKVESGDLEIILGVDPLRNFEGVAIHTGLETYYTFLPNPILDYGKRVA